ncbi:hypothetical protein SynWH8101_0379 [Synechococcus sp. WH 8101]|jgi:hypothetical protein|uniref:DUF565 domain-containing protein n=1 Tax=Synechococcus sp. WH 8101 TaxID=59932 RepID=UPI0010233A7C|nr:DUF565 domain-containing protein [Synechococcus sp. WH 8101]QBE67989.1 hypothetical protein SynWH8101_0379 [Synechococcus sp. WH 8101]QNI44195.1 putative membrane protein Ycf20 [Synechococcus sp. WH 8101]
MTSRLQSTRLQTRLGEWTTRLSEWAQNPWRRSSLLLIVLMTGFFLGNAIGSITGANGLMDPIAALVTVVIWEVMVRLRRSWRPNLRGVLGVQMLDMARIGLLYGLLLEGFKLL